MPSGVPSLSVIGRLGLFLSLLCVGERREEREERGSTAWHALCACVFFHMEKLMCVCGFQVDVGVGVGDSADQCMTWHVSQPNHASHPVCGEEEETAKASCEPSKLFFCAYFPN